jgi:dipeptidase E
MSKLLLLSNSTMPGTPFFTWPRPLVKAFLGDKPRNLVFIPYAAVTFPMDEYEDNVRRVFNEMNYSIFSIHNVTNKLRAIEDSDGIVVGGGNTFALLSRVYNAGIREIIQVKVDSGTPYIGWSAGANLACPTLMTTNDMPIIQPPSFDALGLVPFQINPHYHELRFENQGGETRRERLQEFLVMNPHLRVVGLPEGTGILRDGDRLTVQGEGIARIYQSGKGTVDVSAAGDASFLLK